MTVIAFTSIAANYLPKARVLARSLKRQHPEIAFHAVLIEPVPADIDPAAEPFDGILAIQDLGVPALPNWLFQHTVVEAATGVKGVAVQHFLARPDCDGVLFFDPDIVVLGPLDPVLAALDRADLLLTPHILAPERDLAAIRHNELSVLKHGLYNLGFAGFANRPGGRAAADWWAGRLADFCFDDVPNGMFTDQRWMDLAPVFFPATAVLRDPCCNLAPWNLTARPVEGSLARGLSIAGDPVRFFHFSGLDSGAFRRMLDHYGPHLRGLYELDEWYRDACAAAGQARDGGRPWPYASFADGAPIPLEARRFWRDHPDLALSFPDPFATPGFKAWFATHRAQAAPPA